MKEDVVTFLDFLAGPVSQSDWLHDIHRVAHSALIRTLPIIAAGSNGRSWFKMCCCPKNA